ncbi:ATP-dependent endonuclease [Lysobacter sp. TY2-98]|uniref:AAA family ATPase n=1 Tax=Lysobacter sp. TY2-98 TaxID=2290922 RepID=UPI000E20A3E9|nr:AAA family ATPase [Lysobacter sp. TY2-98]AXK72838.1 ATP-dependent endonuclease [Lysobacter sp. TY2-98]
MHIQYVEVGNFRKLQSVRIDFAERTTVFVGANNSGKTSAMVALRRFLIERDNFSINDLTLCHWAKFDAAAAAWESADSQDDGEWASVLPHLDVWLSVPIEQLHYVQKLLPTLDWNGSYIGVRLRYEPKDVEALKAEYLAARTAAAAVMKAAQSAGAIASASTDAEHGAFALWPRSMMDFLSKRLRSTFEVRAYLLDPAKLVDPVGGIASPQLLADGAEPIEGDPFKGLIRIDEISAQRGFGFAPKPSKDGDEERELPTRSGRKLSSQLRAYYAQHLDPFEDPEPKDLEALQALHQAQSEFGKRLATSFASALQELEQIGYPGVTDPKLTLSTNIKPVDGLNHASAVQYEVPTYLAVSGYGHRLPEESNGLGYQNLVSIVFALMSFRDKWMRVGRAAKSVANDEAQIPPLHLVLIEEPEAHLHAQVQQVFITQAYGVLRKHSDLGDAEALRTQLVVSTHSSHLAHEADFASLRYFRRLPVKEAAGSIPISSVVNLSRVFGHEDETARFVKRYLKVTHCDLFFADAAILVEGPAERILLPHFVRTRAEYEYLRRAYITWLEIGGSHAHRLRPLLEQLGIHALIVTDIDAKDADNRAVPPCRNAGLRARNETLKTWIPKEDSLDSLLDKAPAELIAYGSAGCGIRVAYQQPIQATFEPGTTVEALANTFEDALIYENVDAFRDLEGTGLIARFRDALGSYESAAKLAERLANALSKGGKAELAMDLLHTQEIDALTVPAYIDRGLLWLAEQLRRKDDQVDGKMVAILQQDAANDAVPTEQGATA